MAFHFFTEPSKIQNQNESQAFGAIDVNQYRLGDEHIMREIEKFKRSKGLID